MAKSPDFHRVSYRGFLPFCKDDAAPDAPRTFNVGAILVSEILKFFMPKILSLHYGYEVLGYTCR